jgi:FixJ family two-component response regulator
LEDQQILARRLVKDLDAAEEQILRFVVRGLSDRQIAAATSSDWENVRRFRASLMMKLNARTAADAVRIGLYAEVDPPD